MPIQDSDLFLIDDGGTPKKVTAANLLANCEGWTDKFLLINDNSDNSYKMKASNLKTKVAESTTRWMLVEAGSSRGGIVAGTSYKAQNTTLSSYFPAGAPYWSLEIRPYAYDALTSAASNGPRVDSSGNVYSTFYMDDSSDNPDRLAGLLKTTDKGVLQWVRGYSSTSTTVSNYGFDASSSGDIFQHIRQGNYIEHQLLATDGTTTSWTRSIGSDPNDRISGEIACRFGASGDYYITGADRDNIISKSKFALFKLDSNGAISWARVLHGQPDQGYITPGRIFGIDSSDNTYHCINRYVHPISPRYTKCSEIAKYNSSGTLQWKREFRVGSISDWDVFDLKGTVCDSSGNSYSFGRYVQANSFSGSRGIIVKMNSSGTTQWVKQIVKDSDGYGGELNYSGDVDSSGNFYATTSGRHNSDRNTIVVHKWNSDGAPQWSRKLYYNQSAINMSWGYCSVDSNDNLYVTGYINYSGARAVCVLKVPTDGTETGDYGNVTWASISSPAEDNAHWYESDSPLTDAPLSQVEAAITIPQTNISSPSINTTSYLP